MHTYPRERTFRGTKHANQIVELATDLAYRHAAVVFETPLDLVAPLQAESLPNGLGNRDLTLLVTLEVKASLILTQGKDEPPESSLWPHAPEFESGKPMG